MENTLNQSCFTVLVYLTFGSCESSKTATIPSLEPCVLFVRRLDALF